MFLISFTKYDDVVVVKKKNGKLRMCIDYRQLNNNTKNDSYALPRIEELLDSLGGNTYLTTVDMKSGYHQVEILKIEHGWWYSPVTLFEWSIII
jgi:uncharacterized membrane protein